jgi:hypothetical protein
MNEYKNLNAALKTVKENSSDNHDLRTVIHSTILIRVLRPQKKNQVPRTAQYPKKFINIYIYINIRYVMFDTI